MGPRSHVSSYLRRIKAVFFKDRMFAIPKSRLHSAIVWVSIDKESGEIVTGYCSCFAGLGSTCNHLAALFF